MQYCRKDVIKIVDSQLESERRIELIWCKLLRMQLNIENEVKFKNSKEYSIDDSFVVSKLIKSGMDEEDYRHINIVKLTYQRCIKWFSLLETSNLYR